MFLQWKWNKKENISEPEFKGSRYTNFPHLEELIRTIARNRLGIWIDQNIDLTVEQCVKEAMEDYNNWILKQHSKDVLSNYQIIDKLEKIFYNIEIRHSKVQKLCALEYGM